MAERASGPVKPPVIDLTARAGARPEADKPDGPAPGIGHRNDNPPRPRLVIDRTSWPLLGGVAVGGAVLGTVLTYLVAMALPLPTRQPPDLSADVAAQAGRLDTLEQGLGELTTRTTKTQVSLDATIAQLDGDVSAIDKSIGDLKASIPASAPAVDLTPLETELKTLQAQVDAMAAGASGADAGAIAKSLGDLDAGVASLTTRLNGVDASLTTLRTDVDAAKKALADHIQAALPNEAGPALRLPLILSGLEAALMTGRPFQEELTALADVMPGLDVPAALGGAAATGLPRPDALMQRFEALVPDIYAARDTSGGDWTQNVLDWGKSLLALRPAEEQQGNSPEAVVSRLEGAMGRRDYAAAAALLAQLPAPMQAAAAPVAGDIAALAAADKLVADIRARGLDVAETPK